MKRILLLTFLISSLSVSAKRLLVRPGGTGDGTSWEQATGNLQVALSQAQAGDEIWVAAGTYVPSANDRTVSFVIPSGVKVFGGFTGVEKDLSERNPAVNQTILSGEIGDPSTNEDNSYTVVYLNTVSAETWLDGLVIMGGAANGFEDGADPTTCGGAIFNLSLNGTSAPVIRNCIFRENYAREGGAIYNYGSEGVCLPTILACLFERNKSDFNGGAIFNNGDYGTCSATIENCEFADNQSNYGAGILNQGAYGECVTTINACVFSNNFAVMRGAAYYENRESRGTVETKVNNCRFEDNISTTSEGVEEMPKGTAPEAGPSGASLRTISH